MTLSVHLTVSNYERSGAQGNEGGAIDNGALPHRAYRSPGISFAHGSGWAGYDRRNTYYTGSGIRTFSDPVPLRLGEEHGHGDCCTC
jgi:hypothetical protein